MLKIFKSNIVLEQMGENYLAILRVYIWQEGKAFVVDYAYGKYPIQTTTLKTIFEDALNQYASIVSEFAADNIG